MVGQEPVLYARSLSENIAYGLLESEWSQDDVQEAAKLANAHMFICEMKDKYKTQTGEKGTQLSGKTRSQGVGGHPAQLYWARDFNCS